MSQFKGQIGETKFKSFNNLNILKSMTFENMVDNRFFSNNQQLESYQNMKKELKIIDHLILKELASY